MSALSKVLRSVEGGRIMFRCPGCESAGMGFAHVVTVDPPPGYAGPRWSWNGNVERPTVSPSVLCKSSRDGHGAVCHLFLTDGKIQYLSDCKHPLAGQTVELPSFDDDREEWAP